MIALLGHGRRALPGRGDGKAPCGLCWHRRIAMFPPVAMLGVGLLASDDRTARYLPPLAWAGWAIALCICLIFWGIVSEATAPCSLGVSCADADVQLAGVVPIPPAFGLLRNRWSMSRLARIGLRSMRCSCEG